MLTDEQQSAVASAARTLQIILGSLTVGPVAFAAVALAIRDGEPEFGVVTILGIALTVVAVLTAAIIPTFLEPLPRISATSEKSRVAGIAPQDAAQLGPAYPLLAAYQTRKIITGALIEGPTFLNVMAYFLEGQILSLGLAAALMVVQALLIPTQSSVASWLVRELRRVADETELRTSR